MKTSFHSRPLAPWSVIRVTRPGLVVRLVLFGLHVEREAVQVREQAGLGALALLVDLERLDHVGDGLGLAIARRQRGRRGAGGAR